MANTNTPRPRGSIVRDHAGRELGRIVGGAGVHGDQWEAWAWIPADGSPAPAHDGCHAALGVYKYALDAQDEVRLAGKPRVGLACLYPVPVAPEHPLTWEAVSASGAWYTATQTAAGYVLTRSTRHGDPDAAPCGTFASLEAALDAARRDAGEV